MRISGALAAVAVLAAAVAAAAASTREPGAPLTYELPAVGEVTPIVAPDGAPAFLARDDHGDVRAFLAIAPHSGLPLAWWPTARVFVEPLGASRFSVDGQYTFGPAPHGLRPYHLSIDGAGVRVGALTDPPPRPPPPVEAQMADVAVNAHLLEDVCSLSEGYAHGIRPPIAALPDVPVHRLAAGGWARSYARVETTHDGIRVRSPRPSAALPTTRPSPSCSKGRPPPLGASVTSDVLGYGERGTLRALVRPHAPYLWPDQQPTATRGDDTWCAQGDLVDFRFTPPARVTVATVRPPTSLDTACDYGLPHLPPPRRGTTLDLRATGYAESILQYLASAATYDRYGPMPGAGQPGDVLADGTITAGELAGNLHIDPPITVVLRHDAGHLTGLWIPPPAR